MPGARWVALTKGRFALVDEADFAEVSMHSWCLCGGPNPGAQTGIGSVRKETMHRLILRPAKGLEVDHVNGDRLDNRRANLRLCTMNENHFNLGRRADNRSGFKGVSRCVRNGRMRWQAHIHARGRHFVLGRFDTPEAAHEAYKAAAVKLHGEFANFGERSCVRS